MATIASGPTHPGNDNAAHVGGFGFGRPAWHRTRSSRRRRARALACTGRVRLTAIVLIASIPESGYRWREELKARSEIRAFLQDDTRIVDRWQEVSSIQAEARRRPSSNSPIESMRR